MPKQKKVKNIKSKKIKDNSTSLQKRKIQKSNINYPNISSLEVKRGLTLNKGTSLNPFNNKLYINYVEGYKTHLDKLKTMRNTSINNIKNKNTTNAIRPSTQEQILEIQKREQEISQQRKTATDSNSEKYILKNPEHLNISEQAKHASEVVKFYMNMPPNISNHMSQYIKAQEQMHKQNQTQLKSKNNTHVIKRFKEDDAIREYIKLYLKSQYIPTENSLALNVNPLKIPMPILPPPPSFSNKNTGNIYDTSMPILPPPPSFSNKNNEGYVSRPPSPTFTNPSKQTRYGQSGTNLLLNEFYNDNLGNLPITYVGGNYSKLKTKHTLKNYKKHNKTNKL
jgi:hypothetical protein